ncbi:MAG: antibiotic biosynthesis monooxygenase [Campylobacterales bacterium]|nr:antibiotic biosynthesis monooxygenase [Campylobacterales bacterium]
MIEVVVIAKIKIKEEFYSEVYEELKNLHNRTRKYDKGCIQYDLHESLEDRYSFVFIETWTNPDSLEEHENKDDFKKCIETIANKLESIQIDKLKKVNL